MCWNLELEICLEFGIWNLSVGFEPNLVKYPQIRPVIIRLILI